MSKSAIFLSGWEYNRILADEPLSPTQSGLPAQVLWNGSAQFWLFEKVFCSQESLDGDMTGTEFGWTTGRIFSDLEQEGFLVPVKWPELAAKHPKMERNLRTAWSELRKQYPEHELLALLEKGRDDELEGIKLRLLTPILQQLNCVQNISPNSIRHWMEGERSVQTSSVVTSGLRSLAEQITRDEMGLRAGFTLCQPPGTGVDPRAVYRQQQVERDIQKPMIPRLLAGLLPNSDYLDALRPTANVYGPINQQLDQDYRKNIDRLKYLRDLAQRTLWTNLHGEWLPRLEEEKASYLPEFRRLISDALLRARFDPYLEWFTDIAVTTLSAALTIGIGVVLRDAGVDPLTFGAFGVATGGAAKRVVDGAHKEWRKRTDALTLFYQKARRDLRR